MARGQPATEALGRVLSARNAKARQLKQRIEAGESILLTCSELLRPHRYARRPREPACRPLIMHDPGIHDSTLACRACRPVVRPRRQPRVRAASHRTSLYFKIHGPRCFETPAAKQYLMRQGFASRQRFTIHSRFDNTFLAGLAMNHAIQVKRHCGR